MIDLQRLRTDVQHNCHISDALFARDYSLCIYLLKMREYFRWEMGYGYAAPLPDRELGEWLVEREQLWQRVEDAPYRPLHVGTAQLDAFASEEINALLAEAGLIYSGGYGGGATPHFFLADREREIREGPLHILIAGREHARDLTAPPAMTLGTTVYVRRESLRRLLWERLEEWRWRKQETPMARAAHFYNFDADVEMALDAMTEAEIGTVILHERGEMQVGAEVGGDWEEMLALVSRTRTEYVLRAVRDHLADCLITLPQLLADDARASLHFYFANLTGMRRALFPSLVKSYEAWHESGNQRVLADAVSTGQHHWRAKAHALLDCYRAEKSAEKLERMCEGVEL